MDTQSSIFGAAEGFFEWWINELRSMVPAALLAGPQCDQAAPLTYFSQQMETVTVHSSKPNGGLPTGPGRCPQGASFCAGRAPGFSPFGGCFQSVMPDPQEHPAQARLKDTRKILEMEIAEKHALDPDEIYADWYVETEDPTSGQLHIRQIILSRHRIATLRQILEDEHLHLSRLTVGHGEGRPVPLIFWRAMIQLSGVSQCPVVERPICLGAGAVLLCACLFCLSPERQQMAALQQRRAEAMRQLQAAPAADPLALSLAIQPSPALVLDELSSHLPEDATLASLELANGNLTVTLAAPAKTQLSAALQQSKLLVGRTRSRWRGAPVFGCCAGRFALIDIDTRP